METEIFTSLAFDEDNFISTLRVCIDYTASYRFFILLLQRGLVHLKAQTVDIEMSSYCSHIDLSDMVVLYL